MSKYTILALPRILNDEVLKDGFKRKNASSKTDLCQLLKNDYHLSPEDIKGITSCEGNQKYDQYPFCIFKTDTQPEQLVPEYEKTYQNRTDPSKKLQERETACIVGPEWHKDANINSGAMVPVHGLTLWVIAFDGVATDGYQETGELKADKRKCPFTCGCYYACYPAFVKDVHGENSAELKKAIIDFPLIDFPIGEQH